jgi:hypothetical protein
VRWAMAAAVPPGCGGGGGEIITLHI